METVFMGREIHAGQIYRHFKDRLYQILAVAKHSETGEKLVIYQQLYDPFEVYARPLAMFMSEVDHQKYPQVTQKYRFELIEKIVLDHPAGSSEILPKDQQPTGSSKIPSKAQQPAGSSEIPQPSETLQNDTVNPFLLKFLDADTFEEKRNLLIRMKGEMTNRLIDDIAASLDVTVEQGDLDSRFISLLSCVDMRARFEVRRY